MKITVFGATGAVGGECVSQSLAAGHDVTSDERVVMVRESDALEGARPDIRVILNLD